MASLAVGLALAAGCGSGHRSTATRLGPTVGATTPDTSATTAPRGEDQPPPAPPPSTAPAPTHPASVAAALVEAEQAIRNPAVGGAELERAGRSQQDAYRQLVDHPDWVPQALAATPASLRPTVQANVHAGAELRALNKPRTSLPQWRIVPPAPVEELLRYYKAAEEDIGAPWEYLAAIHLVETRMGRIRGTSVAGAQGPMQFLPATWKRYGAGGDINSNRDAIFGAARMLTANGAPRDMRAALYRYNPTPRYVNAVTAYAGQMKANERAYLGYYHWQVYYRMVDGDRLLPVGYGS